MKARRTYLVKHREGFSRVQANRFRVTLISQQAKFYRGLRKVAWFSFVYSVNEEKETNE